MADTTLWDTQTAIPWREWWLTYSLSKSTKSYLHTIGQLNWTSGNNQSDWEDVHRENQCGFGKDRVGGAYDGYYGIYKPASPTFKNDNDNLSQLCSVGIYLDIAVYLQTNSTSTAFRMSNIASIIAPEEIDWALVTGQKYNGIDAWATFPIQQATGCFLGLADPTDKVMQSEIWHADLPNDYMTYLYNKSSGGTVLWYFNNYQYRDALFRNGLNFTCGNFFYPVGGWTYKAGERDIFQLGIQRIRLLYMNGIVNSLSRYSMRTAGGIEVVLNGLALEIPEVNVEAYSYSAAAANWQHRTDKIHFIGREGQGIYTLQNAVDYTIDSNSKITIPSMPAMNKGTYEIKLEQYDLERGNVNPYTSYAGDWRSRSSGEIYSGQRLIFVVSDDPIPKKPPVPYFKWTWRYGDKEIDEYYAPIDVRSTDTFWEGRLGSVSNLRRSVDDKTGLYSVADANVTLLHGSDKHFSKLLSQYTCKAQRVEISHGWGKEPEGWHKIAFDGIVDDHDFQGTKLEVKLKDLTSLYFSGQLPRNVITNADYLNAPDDSYGRGIPEILGEHDLTTGEEPGAIEAICVDETTYKYIQAGGPLKSTTSVYSDGALIDSADYTISVELDGRQYITFDNDQGDNKITFNCTGYFFAPFDSANGYIENPAYILLFILATLTNVPVNFIDMDSFHDLADLLDDAGWGESGRVAITSLEGRDAILKKILYSFGIHLWLNREGKVRVGRKDITSLDPAPVLHAQLEMFDHPDRKYNYNDLVNSIKIKANFFPAPDIWDRVVEYEDTSSINWFRARYQVSEPWEFPWNSDTTYVNQRILEEALKYSYGYKKAEIRIPIDYIDDLDIFDNVRVQDPYAPSSDGAGDEGRYYYISAIDYEWENQSMRLELVDLTWLIQQYFIFGDEDAMPDEWTDAGDLYRLYGYLCNENNSRFSDLYPGKILIDENLVLEE